MRAFSSSSKVHVVIFVVSNDDGYSSHFRLILTPVGVDVA